MLNAVIDTNVLVSGLLAAQGNPAHIVNAFRDRKFNLVYCSGILEEYRDVLHREKLGLDIISVEVLLDEVRRIGLPVVPDLSDVHLIDEDDRIFLDTAKSSGALLVTGNIKHYPNEPFITTPATFVQMLWDPFGMIMTDRRS